MNGEVLLERARALVGPRPYFRPQDWEDQVSVVVVALCERRSDPVAALRAERSRQRAWANVAWLSPMFTGEGDWHDD
jgi:hypothetical protein